MLALAFLVLPPDASHGFFKMQEAAAYPLGPPPTWTFTPVLKAVDVSGTELPSPVRVHVSDDENASVRIALSVRIRESGSLDPDRSRNLEGNLGIDAFGGAIYFTGIYPSASDVDTELLDISAIVAETIDRLAPQPGAHTANFVKYLSRPDEARWQFAWLSVLSTLGGKISYVRGAWCHPGEPPAQEGRSCEISLGDILVPVVNIPPGFGVSLKVGHFEIEDGKAGIKPFAYVSHEAYLTPVVDEGNTVVVKSLAR